MEVSKIPFAVYKMVLLAVIGCGNK